MYTGRLIIELETEDGIILSRKSAISESDLETLSETFADQVFYRAGRMASDLLDTAETEIEKARAEIEASTKKKKATKSKKSAPVKNATKAKQSPGTASARRLDGYVPEPWAVKIARFIFDQASSEGDAVEDITTLGLEALMSHQANCCAVLGTPFIIPGGTALRDKSYKSWLRSAKEEERIRAPLPLRIHMDEPWGVNNIAYVVPSIRDIYALNDYDPMEFSVMMVEGLSARLNRVFDPNVENERAFLWLHEKGDIDE